MVTNKEQFGIPGLEVKGITIHNTGNSLSAKEICESLERSVFNNGAHYFVDDEETIQFMPLDWCVFHTGMGIDWACKHTIAIEICKSQSDLETYEKAQKRAIKLIKKLMKEYDIDTSKIYFHNDFKRTTYCPHRILDLYKTKKEFIRRYL